jgi:peptidyl-prolyl cis-trans isomerase C
VIEVLETRTSQPPTYDQVHDEIKQQVLQADVQAAIASAKAGVKITMYNPQTGAALPAGQTPSLPMPPGAKPTAAPAGK